MRGRGGGRRVSLQALTKRVSRQSSSLHLLMQKRATSICQTISAISIPVSDFRKKICPLRPLHANFFVSRCQNSKKVARGAVECLRMSREVHYLIQRNLEVYLQFESEIKTLVSFLFSSGSVSLICQLLLFRHTRPFLLFRCIEIAEPKPLFEENRLVSSKFLDIGRSFVRDGGERRTLRTKMARVATAKPTRVRLLL